MKKFYTLALAAAVAFSAAAIEVVNAPSAEVVSTLNLNKRTIAVRENTSKPMRAADYSNVQWNYAGKGACKEAALSAIYGLNVELSEVDVYEAEGTPGLYKLVGLWPDATENGTMIVDATDPEYVIIPIQYSGIDDTVDGEAYIASQSALVLEQGYSKEDIIDAAPEYVITLEDGIIELPAGTICIKWPNAPADSSYETDSSKWYTAGEEEDSKVCLPGSDYVLDWLSLGTGTFLDNVICPLFNGGVENTTVADVAVYVSNEDPNVYRVSDPFKVFYANNSIDATSPYMYFDANDSDDVFIEMCSTGVGNTTDGLYLYFSESYYAEYFDEDGTYERVAENITLTRDGENCTLTIPEKSVFLIGYTSGNMYYGARYESTLKFVESESGIENVVVDTEAPAEYFNLQGVRVQNPANGLYIVRQGAKSTKVLVK